MLVNTKVSQGMYRDKQKYSITLQRKRIFVSVFRGCGLGYGIEVYNLKGKAPIGNRRARRMRLSWALIMCPRQRSTKIDRAQGDSQCLRS